MLILTWTGTIVIILFHRAFTKIQMADNSFILGRERLINRIHALYQFDKL